MKKEKNYFLNSMKLLLSFVVVCAHKPFFIGGDYIIPVSKIPVPFFIVVSGFFSWKENKEERHNCLKKHSFKIFKLMIYSNIFYFIFYLIINFLNHNLVGYIKRVFSIKSIIAFLVFNQSPVSGHLWFLGSLLYVYLIMMVINKYDLYDKAYKMIPILYIIYIVISRYFKSIFGITLPMYVYRNFILSSLPPFLIGSLLNMKKDKVKEIKNLYLIVGFILLLLANWVEYKILGTEKVPFIAGIFLFIVVAIFSINNSKLTKNSLISTFGEKYSLDIYIYHIAVMYILDFLFLKLGIYDIYKYIAPILIFIVTLIFTIIKFKIFENFKSKKNLKLYKEQ